MNTFILCRAQHAPLFERYDLNANRFAQVGNATGQFGREDYVTGAEYKCLGEGNRRSKVMVSRDYKCGLFYPETIFVLAEDDKGKSLSHEEIERFCLQLRYTKHRRVILPKGFEKGQNTWSNAVMYVPPEWKPNWQSLPAIVKQQFPNAEVYAQEYFIEVCC